MATLRAAKQALRREIKGRVAALSDAEKRRQSQVVSEKVRKRKSRRKRRALRWCVFPLHDEHRKRRATLNYYCYCCFQRLCHWCHINELPSSSVNRQFGCKLEKWHLEV